MPVADHVGHRLPRLAQREPPILEVVGVEKLVVVLAELAVLGRDPLDLAPNRAADVVLAIHDRVRVRGFPHVAE